MPIKMKSNSPQVKTIMVYGKSEIVREIALFGNLHRADINRGVPYLVCRVKCIDEAVTLIALLMREAFTTPGSFYYSRKTEKLFVCCEHLGFDSEYLKKVYLRLIHKHMENSLLKHLTVDERGDPLFRKSSTGTQLDDNSEDFHKNRDFPFNVDIGRPLGPKDSHERKGLEHQDVIRSIALSQAFDMAVVNPSDMETE